MNADVKEDPYAALRWRPSDAEGLTFDEHYRLAQLPLVMSGHPLALAARDGFDYRNGYYKRPRISLIADLGAEFLASATCELLLARVLGSSFAPKVATDLFERRAPNLHATLFGDLRALTASRVSRTRAVLEGAHPLVPSVHGPFIGRFNRGRIYLPLEFTSEDQRLILGPLSAILGKPTPELIAVGLINLRDELTCSDAGELASIIRDLCGRREPWSIERFSVAATNDDLALTMRRRESLELHKVPR